jgi:ankyrin repeat protein
MSAIGDDIKDIEDVIDAYRNAYCSALCNIHVAVHNNDRMAVNACLLLKPESENDHETTCEMPLHKAAQYGHRTIARDLIAAGGMLVGDEFPQNITPLHSAAEYNRPEIVADFIEAGADVHAQDWAGRTALHRAVCFNHVGIVRMLLSYGAERNIKDMRDRTALDYALEYNYDDIVEVLDTMER